MTLEALLFSLGGQVAGRVIARRFGPDLGDLATDVLSQLGAAFGVANPTEDTLAAAIEKAPEAKAREAVAAVEQQTAEQLEARVKLQRAENESLKLTNEQIREEKQGHWFGWAWRPASMWGLGLLWFWSIPGLHLVNAVMKWQIPPTDLTVLLSLTGLYCTLYMGGHTLKDFVAKKWGSS